MNSKNVYRWSVTATILLFCSNLLGYIQGVSYLQYVIIIISIMFIPGYIIVRKNDFSIWIVSIFWTYILIVTMFNGADIKSIAHTIKTICGVIVVYSLGKICLKSYLKGVYSVAKVMLLLNTLSCFFINNGILKSETGYPVYILGTRNSMGAVIIYLILMMLIYDEKYFQAIRKSTIIVCIIGAAGSVYLWSATTIIALGIILIYAVTRYNAFFCKMIDAINIKITYIFGILCFLLINIFRMQEVFAFLIESVLKRTINFTARTYIWDIDMVLIKNKFFFGYGQYSKELLRTAYFQPENAHNFFFELFLMGGIVGFLIFSYMILKTSKKLNTITDKKVSEWICCYFLIIMITGITESTILNFGVYAMFALINVMSNNQKEV